MPRRPDAAGRKKTGLLILAPTPGRGAPADRPARTHWQPRGCPARASSARNARGRLSAGPRCSLPAAAKATTSSRAHLRPCQLDDPDRGAPRFGDGPGHQGDAEATGDQVQQRVEIADLEGGATLDARLDETPVDKLARAPGRLEVDKGIVAERRQRHITAAGQRMVGRADHHQRLAGDQLGFDLVRRFAKGQDSEIEPSAADLVEEVRGAALAKPHLDPGVLDMERRQ